MEKLSELLQAQFNKICETGKLYKSNVSGQKIWDIYLDAFTPEDNPKFRDPESSVHNCNHCKNFIRRYGNVVAIDNNYNIITIFDVDCDKEYQKSMNEMSSILKSSKISNVFFETFDSLNSLPYESCKKNQESFRLGINKNVKRYTREEAEKFGVVKPNELRTFHHIHLHVPKRFVKQTSKSIESIQADYRSAKDVFHRTMEEIPLDTLNLVQDLIKQGSLLNGDSYLNKVEQISKFTKEYQNVLNLTQQQKDNYSWVNSYELPIAKFKNELIGVLCTELAEGKDLNKCCLDWNKRVDPANYMKAVAPITKTQKDNAQKFCEENGYIESFNRRLATLDDINIEEIKHINQKQNEIKTASIFDSVKTKSTKHKRSEFNEVETVSIDKFMKDILPTCESVEAFLDNSLENNMVTLTTSNDKNSKQIFSWNNPFSWTYNGNLAGKSMIKEAVKSQGGKVDGVLRFSIMWSEGGSTDDSDLDAHCIEPVGGEHIYYSHKKSYKTGGNLDIDITDPNSHKRNGREVVENIIYPSLEKMIDGVYTMKVKQFSARNSEGFKAEIEFNGELHSFEYNQPVGSKRYVEVAKVTLKNGVFSIEPTLPSTSSSKDIYGLESQQFHKVNLVCLSPNYWGENNVGHKHYFFMLENAKTDKSIRSFHTENLMPSIKQHRKVLDVLGAVNMLEPTDKQLSGLGFNATVRSEVILRLKGSHKRVIKVIF